MTPSDPAAATGGDPAERMAVVVVTYNRSAYLEALLASIEAMSRGPWRVVVVDNASTDDTGEVLARWQAQWGERLVVLSQAENTGGAGGFSAGTAAALDLGAEWLWLMDDDVEVLPDALVDLAPWLGRFRCVTGRKYDFDGTPFRWQNRFDEFLGVPRPLPGDPFAPDGWFEQTAGNFEGMAIHRSVVEQIGLPDPRFFIVWDDAIYGWLAHLVTECAVVDAFVLKRARVLQQRRVGTKNLNATGDRYRFYVMRNRALMRFYLRDRGRLNRLGFAIGTAYTFAKELVRLVRVERRLTGGGELVRGWVESRRLMRDRTWQPMPPLAEVAP